MLFIWILPVFALLLFAYTLLQRRGRYRFPPGPKGLPVVGSLLEGPIDRPQVYFSELRKKYGDIFTVHLMGRTMVVLNSVTAIREFFASSEKSSIFSGRPIMILNKYIDGGKAITSMTYCDVWVKLRKLVHKTLHMYGEGVDSMEAATQSELQYVVEWVEEHEGRPFNPEDVIVPSSINNMSTLILGKRLDYKDEAHLAVMEYNRKIVRVVSVSVGSIIMKLPFLRHIPYGYGKIFQDGMAALDKLLYYLYEEPKKTYDCHVTRGLLDVLLRTQEEERMPDGSCWLDDDVIRMNIKDLLVAGSATTRGALMSFFLITTYQPDVTKRIQNEIDDVIGNHRYPSIKDRPYMPYTEATVWELLRYISHAPLAVPHCTLEDVHMGEYFVPANTTVVSNLWEVHHDPELWDEPWEFRPQRFLDPAGHMVDAGDERRKNVVAFGVGKRSCAGETFARSRLFLYITTLLQRFDFRSAEGEKLPSADPREFVPGIVLQPDKYRLQATPRIV